MKTILKWLKNSSDRHWNWKKSLTREHKNRTRTYEIVVDLPVTRGSRFQLAYITDIIFSPVSGGRRQARTRTIGEGACLALRLTVSPLKNAKK